MKKLCLLFVLCFGFMSFSSKNVIYEDSSILQMQTCCTVAIEFEGQPAGEITRCIPGEGPTATALACLAANNAAAYVKKKNKEFQP